MPAYCVIDVGEVEMNLNRRYLAHKLIILFLYSNQKYTGQLLYILICGELIRLFH